MENLRCLTLKDMEGIDTKGKDRFDILVATAVRAKQILENHEAAQKQETNTRKTTNIKRKRERQRPAPRIASHGGGEGTSAAAFTAKTKKSKKKNTDDNGPQPPPPLPQEFKDAIQETANGKNTSQARLVIQKILWGTDVSSGHNRLSIPNSKTIVGDFLTEEERRHLCGYQKNSKNRNYIDVKIIEPSLEVENVKIRKWDMKKHADDEGSFCYVINERWNNIVDRNELREGMVVQLWSFRIEEELCFALVKLPD